MAVSTYPRPFIFSPYNTVTLFLQRYMYNEQCTFKYNNDVQTLSVCVNEQLIKDIETTVQFASLLEVQWIKFES